MPPENLSVGVHSFQNNSLIGLLVVVAAVAMGGCANGTTTKAAVSQATDDKPKAKETRDVAEELEKAVATSREPELQVEKELPADPFPRKVPAPPLDGGIEWLNTAGPITIESLRGKVVLLDFWTYCCINCMHVLPDLKKLEEKYPDQLVVIGVHSAKFDAERDSQNIREAILRYEISHPVVNDANMIIWRHFDVHAWPTIWLIDPEGNAVGRISAEGVFDPLDQAIGKVVAYHRAKGTLKETPVQFDLERTRVAETPLRFPGKLLADAASDRLFISDSNHNRIVITTLSGKLIDVAGTGEVGHVDGSFDRASFFRPQGLALDGDVLYVADTENHMIRQLDLKARTVSIVAGTGEQGTSRSHRPMPAKEALLNSPWDLWQHDGKLFIAMAGPHQIWVWNSKSNEVHAFAGSGREDIEDGEAEFAALAQPSGLASDGKQLFVADSEVSGIRAISFETGDVHTIVGQGLFDFGDVDGEKEQVRLQHPLGLAWADGSLFVADTYNNKIKAIDPGKRSSTTFLGDGEPGKEDDPPQFDEPGGLSAAGGKLYIADSNNHVIRIADLETKRVTTLELAGLTPPQPKTSKASLPVFPNARTISLDRQTLPVGTPIELRVKLEIPEGYELNELAPIVYLVESVDSPSFVQGDALGKAQLLRKPKAAFSIPLLTGDSEGSGNLRVSLTYYQCREEASGLCEVKSVIWEIPVTLSRAARQNSVGLVASEILPNGRPRRIEP